MPQTSWWARAKKYMPAARAEEIKISFLNNNVGQPQQMPDPGNQKGNQQSSAMMLGAGPDGKVDPNRPAAIDMATKPPSVYHDGEMLQDSAAGRKIIPASQVQMLQTPQQVDKVKQMQDAGQTQGFATGGTQPGVTTVQPPLTNDQLSGIASTGLTNMQQYSDPNSAYYKNQENTALNNLQSRQQWGDLYNQQQLAQQPFLSTGGANAATAMQSAKDQGNLGNLAGTLSTNATNQAQTANAVMVTAANNQVNQNNTNQTFAAGSLSSYVTQNQATLQGNITAANVLTYDPALTTQLKRAWAASGNTGPVDAAWAANMVNNTMNSSASTKTNFDNLVSQLNGYVANNNSTDAQRVWKAIQDNPAFAQYRSSLVEPNWSSVETPFTVSSLESKMVKTGLIPKEYLNADGSIPPALKTQLDGLIQSAIASGAIDKNGEFNGSTMQWPWHNPATETEYIDPNGKPIPAGVDPNTNTAFRATKVSGSDLTFGDVYDALNSASNQGQFVSEYYNADGTLNTKAFTPAVIKKSAITQHIQGLTVSDLFQSVVVAKANTTDIWGNISEHRLGDGVWSKKEAEKINSASGSVITIGNQQFTIGKAVNVEGDAWNPHAQQKPTITATIFDPTTNKTISGKLVINYTGVDLKTATWTWQPDDGSASTDYAIDPGTSANYGGNLS